MDNYPKHLSPGFLESGAVATPFEEWWPHVREEFPSVPEDVAREWLHRHWDHSGYSFLRSRDYAFSLVTWPSEKLFEIRSGWNNFKPDNLACQEKGKDMVTGPAAKFGYWPAIYMRDHLDFPAPIVVLDNRDDHIDKSRGLPAAFVLIEGHRRFNMGLYLTAQGTFTPTPSVWLMTHVGRGGPIA